MAENTKIWPIFRSANWWLSDDIFTGIKNSYYYSNLLEIRNDDKSVYPYERPAISGASSSLYLWTETRAPVAIVQSSSSYAHLFVFVYRSVYDVHITNETVTKLCTFGSNIHDAEMFNWYIYITTQSWLYIISENASSADWSSLPSSNTVTGTEPYLWKIGQFNTVASWHPLYATNTVLCVWDNDEMWKISKETCNTKSTAFSLPEWYTIKLITELWWYVRVVAQDIMRWSEILLWDKVSSAPTEVIPFPWYTFLQTEIYWWYQYLLSNKWLWLLNWYQFYILKNAPEWDVSTSARNGMAVYDDKLYFVTSKWIYIYWAKNKNYPDVLSLWRETKECGCMLSDWQNLFTTSWKRSSDDISYSVIWMNDRTSAWPNYRAYTWELQTMAYFWNSLSEIKQSEYLRVWYKIPSNWNIHVYYRTDADAADEDEPSNRAWHPVQPNDEWLSAKWDMRSPFSTTLKLNCRFQWIQFKFVITNWYKSGDDKYTHLYSADLYYNTMLD